MAYTINANAKNVWIRDNEDTRDLSIQTDASSVYLDNGRTLEQELGEGSMVSNVATVDNSMSKVIDGTLDGVYESGVMYGRTLVNLADLFSFDEDVTTSYNYVDRTVCETSKLKLNTSYLFIFKPNVSSNLSDYTTFEIGLGNSINHVAGHPSTVEGFRGYEIKHNQWNYIKMTFTDFKDYKYLAVRPLRTNNPDSTKPITYNVKEGLVVLEYQEGMENWDIPYFEGICDVKMPILRNVGKNLCPPLIVGSTINNNNGQIITDDTTINRARTDYIKINPKKNYIISGINTTDKTLVGFYDENKNYLSRTSGTSHSRISLTPDTSVSSPVYTIPQNASYIILSYYGDNLSAFDKANAPIQIEETLGVNADNVTTHEDHKTNILHTPETVTLRSLPNGVRDELNLKTGEYIKRIGEIVFDGSEDEVWSCANNVNVYVVEVEGAKTDTDAYTIATNSDSIPSETRQNVWNALKDGVALHKSSADGRLLLYKNSINTLDALKLHLQSNPLTVQYELATPITTKVTLTQSQPIVKIGTELPNGVCDTYNLLTGEHIQRVGKVVLDGSESWKNASLVSNDGQYYVSYCPLSSMKKYTIASGVISLTSDKFIAEPPVGDDEAKRRNREFIASYGSNATVVDGESNWIYLSVEKRKIASNTGIAFADYLKSNPVTVWYELANPIVTKKNGLPNTYGITLPNGVVDKYNESTGVYTQNIGKVVLNGGETISLTDSSKENTIAFVIEDYNLNQVATGSDFLLCDRFQSIDHLGTLDVEGITYTNNALGRLLYIRINKSKLSEQNVNGFKKWLSDNVTTVYHQLATPKTIDIPLINVGQVLPNGVCDTYNPITKEYVKTVGEIELKGEESWAYQSAVALTNTVMFTLRHSGHKTTTGEMSDKLPRKSCWTVDEEGFYTDDNNICVRVSKTRLSSPDLNGFKAWLGKTPLTIWYTLKTPITTVVDLDLSTLYSSSPIAYENGHVTLESGHNGQSLLPTLEYSTITNRVKQIESIGEQVLRQEKQLTMLEQMLIQNIIGLDYNNTVLALNLEINEVM